MNFYPFHIGDYASATRHLSWDEDMAYRRLIDAYYTREAPIPLDRRQAYRLVCASTPEQRDAVDVVLSEFFEETPDGWRNSRCDSEIDVCRQKSEKAAQSARSRWSNANAMRTHSERNASDLPVPTDADTYPQKEADAMPSQCERNANASSDRCERIEKACEGNATNTKTNTKSNKTTTIAGTTQSLVVVDSPPIDERDPATLRAIELTALLRARGAKLQASDPRVRAWAEKGHSDAQILVALEKAQQQRSDRGDPSPVNSGYIDAILKSDAPAGTRKSRSAISIAEHNAAAAAEAKRLIFGEEAIQ